MNTEANLQAIGLGIQPPSVHSNPISLKRPRDDESNKQYIQARLQIYAQVSTHIPSISFSTLNLCTIVSTNTNLYFIQSKNPFSHLSTLCK